MIGVIATLSIASGKEEEFENAARDLMAKVKANEPGALTYQLYRSKADASTYIFMEQYADKDALTEHGKTEYFLAAQPALGACLAGKPDIQLYDSID